MEQIDFWQIHGIGYLICLVLFPRITLFFTYPGPWSILMWLGWGFLPRLVIAILATTFYWHTNPVLCVFAWMYAFAGTAGESTVVAKKAGN